MILTTPNGAVNMDRVETLVCSRMKSDPEQWGVLAGLGKTHELYLAKGLTQAAAKFLLQDITRAWTEGYALFSVEVSLQQHADGAYFTEEPA
jgi:hypothetical protein